MLNLRQKSEHAIEGLEGLIMKAERVALSVLHGVHGRRKSGIGENFWQFKEYSQDDEPRMIDWRQSAKGERVYVKQKEWETAQNVLLWCLNSTGMDFSSSADCPSKLECAQVLTLAMGLLSVQSGENIGSIYTDRVGHSEKAVERLATFLVERSEATLPDVAHMRPTANAQMVFAGDFLNDFAETKECFETLGTSVQGGIVIQVLDVAEIELPYDGRVQFLHPDGGEKIRVEHVRSVREDYRERVAKHNELIEKLCRDLGWVYVLHRTDREMSVTLRDVAAKLEERSGRG